MLKRFTHAAWWLAGATACWLAVSPDSGYARAQQPDAASIDAIFADLAQPGSPGCALGVFRDGSVVYSNGYGLANLEDEVPITSQTVFDVGSISKQFTAASVLLLEQQGKLRLDDDVRKYIPELTPTPAGVTAGVTIRQLLNHTSGMRDYFSLLPLAGAAVDNVSTDDEALAAIRRQRGLNFVPGTDWQYSNSGYLLLKLIAQRVSGRTLKEFAATEIFQPLGMTHTRFRDDHTTLIPHRALAYQSRGNGSYKLSVSYAETYGDGMLHTTIGDLQKWDENFYTGRVGGMKMVADLEEQATLTNGTRIAYAKGLFVESYRGVRTVYHSGNSGGYSAYLLRFPDQHLSIACLCNLVVNRSARVRAVADLYIAATLKPVDAAARAESTPAQLRVLTGTYRDEDTREVWRINMKASTLTADFEGATFDLRQVGDMEFEPVKYPRPMPVTFAIRANGQARTLTAFRFGFPDLVTLQAVDEVHPDRDALTAYAGSYWSDELLATYRLTIKDGALWLTDLISVDGVRRTSVPASQLRPVVRDEFDLAGALLVFRFTRATRGEVSGFLLNGFGERWIRFVRREGGK